MKINSLTFLKSQKARTKLSTINPAQGGPALLNQGLRRPGAPRAIIFDLGNCIIGFDHLIAVKKILGGGPKGHPLTEKSEKEIYNFFFDSELTQNFEKGKISPEEFFKEVKSNLALKIAYREFLPIWNEIFFPMPESEDFVRSLPSDIKLIMLSNINKLHYEYIKDNFASVLALFDKVIPSCVTGFIKPQRPIYDLAVKEAQEKLEDIIYVDDREDLVAKARSYGIASIQFEGAERLRQEFLNSGVLFNRSAEIPGS